MYAIPRNQLAHFNTLLRIAAQSFSSTLYLECYHRRQAVLWLFKILLTTRQSIARDKAHQFVHPLLFETSDPNRNNRFGRQLGCGINLTN
jgi:hypothetical protein